MQTENAKLRTLLREELTAVHQQFVHMIALREWGDEAFAASIANVDNVDFRVAMKVMNHLVSIGATLDLSRPTIRRLSRRPLPPSGMAKR